MMIRPTRLPRKEQLKKWRRDWKIGLIEEVNPDRRDFYPALLK
jgi:putative endonuclease